MSKIEALCAEEHDDAALVWIDHRDAEDDIVQWLSLRLDEGDGIAVDWRDDDLWATYRGTAHRIPLTFTPHDRYVAIGSVAELVKERYGVYVRKSSSRGDTCTLALLAHAEVAAASEADRQLLDEHFTRVEPGTDYFGGLAVPHVGNEGHNPEFAVQAAALDQERHEVMQAFVQSPHMEGVRSQLQGDLQALRQRRRVKLLLWLVAWIVAAAYFATWMGQHVFSHP